MSYRCRCCGFSYRAYRGRCPACGMPAPFFIRRNARSRRRGRGGQRGGCLVQLLGCFLRLMLSGVLLLLCICFLVFVR